MSDYGVPVSQISGIALESVPSVPIEGNYLYFALSTNPFKLIKVDKTTLNILSEYVGLTGENGVKYGCGFVYNGKAYIGLAGSPTANKCRIAVIDLATMTRVTTIELSGVVTADVLCSNGAVVAGDYGYFIVAISAAGNERLYKIDLTTDTEVGYISMLGGGEGSMEVNHQNSHIVIVWDEIVRMRRIELSSFTVTGETQPTYSLPPVTPKKVIFDNSGDYCYVTNYNYILKLSVTSNVFMIVEITLLSTDIGGNYAVIKDLYQNHLLIGDSGAFCDIYKFNLSERAIVKSLKFSDTYNYSLCSINQGDYSYWGTFNAPGAIIKVQNENLTIKSLVTLPSGYNYPAIALAY